MGKQRSTHEIISCRKWSIPSILSNASSVCLQKGSDRVQRDAGRLLCRYVPGHYHHPNGNAQDTASRRRQTWWERYKFDLEYYLLLAFNSNDCSLDPALYILCFVFLSTAAQQQKPVMMSPAKLVAANTVPSRSYNSGTVVSAPRAVSATKIAREILQTQGIQGLYKGLGATLMR